MILQIRIPFLFMLNTMPQLLGIGFVRRAESLRRSVLAFHIFLGLFLTFLLQIICVGYSLVQDILFTPDPLDFQFEEADVFHPLVMVKVPLRYDGLLDLDLLIQQNSFFVAS